MRYRTPRDHPLEKIWKLALTRTPDFIRLGSVISRRISPRFVASRYPQTETECLILCLDSTVKQHHVSVYCLFITYQSARCCFRSSVFVNMFVILFTIEITENGHQLSSWFVKRSWLIGSASQMVHSHFGAKREIIGTKNAANQNWVATLGECR